MRGSHTTVYTDDDGTTHCVYHETEVCSLTRDRKLTLRTGGWNTATTKRRMNDFAKEYDLPVKVAQDSVGWFVIVHGHEYFSFNDEDKVEVQL